MGRGVDSVFCCSGEDAVTGGGEGGYGVSWRIVGK
jgi:hypothetical protein